MRIVSVCPSNTDLMEHLGLLDWVVGRDSWSDWPEGKVESIPIIGSVLNIDIAAVVALTPDLILASRNVPGMEKVVPLLEETGLPLVVYDPETWGDVIENLTDLGQRLRVSERAAEVVEASFREIDRLREITHAMPWVDLLVEWWPDPIIVPCKETYVNQVLSWVKVRSPFRSREGRSGKISREEVVSARPDLYSISWCGTLYRDYDEQSVYRRFKGTDLPFLSHSHRVFKLWEGIIGHPSLRLLDGANRVLEQRRRAGL